MILATALFVRIYPVVHHAHDKEDNYGLGRFVDTRLYHRIAYNLYTGNGFSGTDDGRAYGLAGSGKALRYEPAVTRGPVYPFFLNLVYRCLGDPQDAKSVFTWQHNWDKARITQCILDVLTCLIVFFITRLIFPASPYPALISAGLYCFSFYNIFYTRELLTESVNTFLMSISLLFIVLALHKGKKYLWWLAGSGCGLTILCRPEYLLFPPVILLYVLWINRKVAKKIIPVICIFVASLMITLSPWVVRNYVVFRKPAITVGSLGYSLFLGTFEDHSNWQGWNQLPDTIFPDKREKLRIELLNCRLSTHLSDGTIAAEAIDREFFKIAVNRIEAHPVEVLQTWITRIPNLWYQDYIPIYNRNEASGLFFIVYFFFGAYSFRTIKRSGLILAGPVCCLFVYLNLIFLPLHVEPRYSVSAIPGIIALAGIGVYEMWACVKNKIKQKQPGSPV